MGEHKQLLRVYSQIVKSKRDKSNGRSDLWNPPDSAHYAILTMHHLAANKIHPRRPYLKCGIDSSGAGEGLEERVQLYSAVADRLARRVGVETGGSMIEYHQGVPNSGVTSAILVNRAYFHGLENGRLDDRTWTGGN